MRHGKKFNHLGRKTAHRKAMMANMACSLIEHKRITTTVAKAKAFVRPPPKQAAAPKPDPDAAQAFSVEAGDDSDASQ